MTFFKTAEKKFASFFSAVGHYMKEVFGDQSVEAKVSGTLTLLTPAVVELVNLAGGPGASALVTAGIAQFKADYATLCAITQGSFPAPGGSAASIVKGLIGSLQQNLTAILADAGVKNSEHKDRISGYATFFLNEADAILEEIEAAPAPKAAPAPVAQMPTPTAAPAPQQPTPQADPTLTAANDAPAAATMPTPTAAPAPQQPTPQADPTLTAANDAPAAATQEDATAAAPAPGHVNVASVKPMI